MKRDEKLHGVDESELYRKASKEILAHAEHETRKAEVDGPPVDYGQRRDLWVLVRQLRADPPLWRMEAIEDFEGIPADQICAQEANPRHLRAELRYQLACQMVRHGVVDRDAKLGDHSSAFNAAAERLLRVDIREAEAPRGLV